MDVRLGETLEDITEEFDNLMQAGLDELAVENMDLANDYFSDAAFVISNLDEATKNELARKYTQVDIFTFM